MTLLFFFTLLLIGAVMAGGACWIGMVWLFGADRADPEAAEPFSISRSLRRELEAHALWRSLSAWMATKPLRIQDQSKRPVG